MNPCRHLFLLLVIEKEKIIIKQCLVDLSIIPLLYYLLS
jgi:hypothetical protein